MQGSISPFTDPVARIVKLLPSSANEAAGRRMTQKKRDSNMTLKCFIKTSVDLSKLCCRASQPLFAVHIRGGKPAVSWDSPGDKLSKTRSIFQFGFDMRVIFTTPYLF